jgi:hypothetical protein
VLKLVMAFVLDAGMKDFEAPILQHPGMHEILVGGSQLAGQ